MALGPFPQHVKGGEHVKKVAQLFELCVTGGLAFLAGYTVFQESAGLVAVGGTDIGQYAFAGAATVIALTILSKLLEPALALADSAITKSVDAGAGVANAGLDLADQAVDFGSSAAKTAIGAAKQAVEAGADTAKKQ